MLRKSTKIKGFKNFDKEITFNYDDITLIKGSNGAGKTTLALDSLLFCIYGYYDQSLSELPTKGKTACYVEEELIHNNHNYKIRRDYPTKLTIYEDDKKLPFVNSRDGQQFLTKLFKNVEYFKKFRMIDNMAGINILEEGKTSLKRTLLSVNQEFFNNIRKRLLDKKRNQEIYNKDKAVVYSHYPSETRLKALNLKLDCVSGEIRGYERDISDLNRDLDQLHRKQGQLESNKKKSQWEKNKLLENETCYACGQELIKGDKDKMLSDKNKEIVDYNSTLTNINNEIKDQLDAHNYLKELEQEIVKKKEKLVRLKMRLEARLKQKDYKYTNRDVLITKETIVELDKFYAYFITEWIKGLEPIINSITKKIGFDVKFKLDDKGNFAISLQKDGQEYNYKNLSNGQKLILSVAFKIALLLERGEEGLIIADEGFSSLDEDNLNHIFTLFQNLPFQLICILHRVSNIPNEIKIIDLEQIRR